MPSLFAQTSPPAPPPSVPAVRTAVTQLYQQLGSVGLDAQRVFKIRDASLDRPGVHLTFSDGEIAFIREVNGHITGAFFEGEGDVLVLPPTRAERASLGLFTGTPSLNEKFTSAYLRFNDASFDELKPGLRELDDESVPARDFVDRWGGAALSLAESDRLRLLMTFAGGAQRDRMLHARLGGARTGPFDVYFDSLSIEQVRVAQVSPTPKGVFLDLWTSFSPGPQSRPVAGGGTITTEAAAGDAESGGFFHISDYKIHAAIHPPRELEATTELTLDAAAPAPRVVLLELSRFLHVSAVSQLEGNAETPLEYIREEAQRGSKSERGSNDVIAIVLPAPLEPGHAVRLRFLYSGDVLFDAGGGLLLVGVRGIWFPNRGFNQAKFDMEFVYPPEWTLVATGGLQSTATENGLRITRWITPEPRPTAGFNLGQFAEEDTSAGDVRVSAFINRNFVPPRPLPRADMRDVPMRRNSGTPAPAISFVPLPAGARAENVAKDAAQAVEWLAARLGPFPYRELRLAETPITSSQGWPGLIYLSTLVFFSEQERERRLNDPFLNVMYGRITVAHETAHQWFGNQVGRASYHDAWFSEAVANYLAMMRFEQQSASDFRLAMEHYRSELLKKTQSGQKTLEAGPVTLGDRLDSSRFPEGYSVIVYGRGTWLMHMLRTMLRDFGSDKQRPTKAERAESDELFFSVLRSLATQFRGKRMSTADVQRAFEAALPEPLRYERRKSLDWFFEGWVNGTAIPRLELNETKFSLRAGKSIATAKLLQRDAPDDLVTSVPIYAAGPSGKPVFVGRVFADGEETALRLNVPAGTRKLLLDPYQTVLRQ